MATANITVAQGLGTSYRLHYNGTAADSVEVEVDGTSPRFTASMNWGALGTWHKLRCVQFGGIASVYLDGVLLGSGGNAANQSADATYVGLKCGASTAKFRNISVWNPTMPALP